jgi:hypothetical protein
MGCCGLWVCIATRSGDATIGNIRGGGLVFDRCSLRGAGIQFNAVLVLGAGAWFDGVVAGLFG